MKLMPTALRRWTSAGVVGWMLLAAAGVGRAQMPQAAPAQAHIADVQILQDGALHGQVVNRQGAPLGHTSLWLAGNNRNVQAMTDDSGMFAVQNLQGGVYLMRVGDQQQVIRAWIGDAAPPSAVRGVTIVQGNVVRGQPTCNPTPGLYDGAIWRTLTNPWLIAGGVAAAIAVPLALDQDNAS